MSFKRVPLFGRLFVKYGILVVGTTSIVALVAIQLVDQLGLRNAEQALRVKASLIGRCAGSLRPDRRGQFQADADALHAATHSRITFLDALGNPLADSDVDLAAIANLADQPEFVAARQGEDRAIIRYSDALGETMICAACQVERPDSRVAFVRVAESLNGVRIGVVDLERSILTSAVSISFGVVFFLSLFLSRYPALPATQRNAPAAPVAAEKTPGPRDVRAQTVAGCLTGLPPEFMVRLTEKIRASLSVIKASGETLLLGALEDTAHRDQFVKQIDIEADQLQRLITDGLMLAEIVSGVRKTHCEVVLLDPLVAACLAGHRARAQAHHLVLAGATGANAACVPTQDRSAAAPEMSAWADEEALGQVLDCLIEMAMHWAPQGGHIRITSSAVQDHVLLSLNIAGTGISAHDLPHVADPFFGVDRTRPAALGVSGLGLAIASQLARTMGGTLRAASGPEQETTLIVCLRREG